MGSNPARGACSQFVWRIRNLFRPVHTSCECEANFEVTGLHLQQMFCRSWTQLNCCELFDAKLWLQNLLCICIHRKYESDSRLFFVPSIRRGSTTSWLMSSKFGCPTQCSMLRLRPVKKLSTTVTSWPCIIKLSVRWEPTNPAPPDIWNRMYWQCLLMITSHFYKNASWAMIHCL